MKRSWFRSVAAVSIVAIGLTSIVGTSVPPRTRQAPTGEILGVAFEPSVVCLNEGPALVSVGFSAQSSNTQCVDITINGESLVSPFLSPESGIQGQNRCGRDQWGETYRFSLATLFGNNIPATVVAEVVLRTGGPVTAPQTELDRRTGRLETRVRCDPPGLLPGG